jgi:hypothetical protein
MAMMLPFFHYNTSAAAHQRDMHHGALQQPQIIQKLQQTASRTNT